MQNDRLSTLAKELQAEIYGKIKSPVAMMRLLAVNKDVAKFAVDYSFPNLKKISIHIGDGGTEPSIINGDEVKPQHLIDAMRQIWKNAPDVTTLCLTGRLLSGGPLSGWLQGNQMIFQLIEDNMIEFPRPLKKLQILMDARKANFPVYSVEGVEHIIGLVSNTLEQVSVGIMDNREALTRIPCFEALGACANLKELTLGGMQINSQNVRTICDNKFLSSIIIHQDPCFEAHDFSPGRIRFEILFGILSGLNENITSLYLKVPYL